MLLTIDDKIKLQLSAVEHAASLYSTINNNRKHLSEFLGWVDNMTSIEDSKNYLKNCTQLYKQGKEVSFVIISDKELVGRIGIHHIDQQNKQGAIGYWLSQKAEGKGIITKSCIALLDYGFGQLNLNRIEIKAATDNYKSQAIPQKLNFIREGVLREAEVVNNNFIDLILYSMLRSEWRQITDTSK